MSRQRKHGERSKKCESDQHKAGQTVGAACVTQVPDQPRREGVSDAARRKNDAHETAQDLQSENVGGHERDDHVIAAQSDAEDHGERVDGEATGSEEKEWNCNRHQQVDQQHHVAFGIAIGEPSHQDAADNAEAENHRKDMRGGGLRIVAVETEIELQILLGTSDGGDRAHAADGEQVEVDVFECPASVGRGDVYWFPLAVRRFLDEKCQWQGQHDNQKTANAQSDLPSEVLNEYVRNQWDQRSAEADAEISKAHSFTARFVEPVSQQNLYRQRAAANVAQRIEHVEKIEETESRNA